jgi:hypothetical protein
MSTSQMDFTRFAIRGMVMLLSEQTEERLATLDAEEISLLLYTTHRQ